MDPAHARSISYTTDIPSPLSATVPRGAHKTSPLTASAWHVHGGEGRTHMPKPTAPQSLPSMRGSSLCVAKRACPSFWERLTSQMVCSSFQWCKFSELIPRSSGFYSKEKKTVGFPFSDELPAIANPFLCVCLCTHVCVHACVCTHVCVWNETVMSHLYSIEQMMCPFPPPPGKYRCSQFWRFPSKCWSYHF